MLGLLFDDEPNSKNEKKQQTRVFFEALAPLLKLIPHKTKISNNTKKTVHQKCNRGFFFRGGVLLLKGPIR